MTDQTTEFEPADPVKTEPDSEPADKRPDAERSEAASALARSHGCESARGMTLVEIMIVVTIMASIMGVVGFYVFGALDQANVKEAKIEIEKLRQMVDQYYVTSTPNQVPDNLSTLTEGPAPITKSIPKDPWGNDYVYEKEGNREFTIYSPGPDGQPGTEDDVYGGEGETQRAGQ